MISIVTIIAVLTGLGLITVVVLAGRVMRASKIDWGSVFENQADEILAESALLKGVPGQASATVTGMTGDAEEKKGIDDRTNVISRQERRR